MCTTHTLELEGPDHVGGQLLGVGQGDAHHAVGLGAPAGPVLKLDNRELVIFTSPLTRSFHSAHTKFRTESLNLKIFEKLGQMSNNLLTSEYRNQDHNLIVIGRNQLS